MVICTTAETRICDCTNWIVFAPGVRCVYRAMTLFLLWLLRTCARAFAITSVGNQSESRLRNTQRAALYEFFQLDYRLLLKGWGFTLSIEGIDFCARSVVCATHINLWELLIMQCFCCLLTYHTQICFLFQIASFWLAWFTSHFL